MILPQVHLRRAPPGGVSPHEGSEKAQNGHVVKGDCTWEIQVTKTWKRELPEGCLTPGLTVYGLFKTV
jgi:hypothetical protein